MRFSTAWAKTAAQNVTLKVATVTLSAVAVTQLFLIGQLALRDLPVIERSCFSKVMSAKSTSPNNAEISAFLSEALGMRFD